MASAPPPRESSRETTTSTRGGIPLSPSVEGVFMQLAKKKVVHAIEITREILKAHREYFKEEAVEIIKYTMSVPVEELSTGPRTLNEWKTGVEALFNTDRITELHGRIFILGLSLLDQQLRENFLPRYVDAIQAELREKIEDILSPAGRRLFLPAKPPGSADYVNNQFDNPVADQSGDHLDRYQFAKFLVNLLNKTEITGAYSLHLFAPWGAGKTSFMNFMKDALKKQSASSGIKWHAVSFNAWQNQKLSYPWWTLMNNFYQQVRSELPRKKRLREWWWRFSTSRLYYVIAIMIIVLLVGWFIATPNTNEKNSFTAIVENVSKSLAGLLAIITIIVTATKTTLLSSKKAAENYLDSQDNPLTKFRDRFNSLIQALEPGKVIIFIDDLDRCGSKYVVDILESIQTIFKDTRVVFVIAADKNWLYACYEVEYEKIKNYVGGSGKSIGPLFIEKMFQLSVCLPGAPPELKNRLWSSMLSGEAVTTSAARATGATTVEERESILKQANQSGDFAGNHATRLGLIESLTSSTALKQTEHFLAPYGNLLDLNPRSMKRLLNNYSVNKAATLLSHQDIEPHQLILLTILMMQWPVLTDHLFEHAGNSTLLNGQTPPAILELLNSPEVKDVLAGGTNGRPLTMDTIQKGRLLFT